MAQWAANFVKRDSFLRMFADLIMVNIALAVAMLIRYTWLVGVELPNQPAGTYFWSYLQSFWKSSLMLSPVALLTFYLTGFYSRGLFYRSRYKALSIVQAVSISYIVFGALTFFFRVSSSGSGDFLVPRSSFLLAWFFTTAILLGSRLWSQFWTHVVEIERSSTSVSTKEIKNVLLIGGAGYIGSALLQKLLERGYHVRLLDLLLFGKEPIRDVEAHPHLEIIQADFRQVDKVVEAMRGMHAVIHLGAIVGDPACAFDEKLTVEVNLMATRMIAEVAKGCGVQRFLFASTCSVYGAGDEILNERSRLNPVSLYARSKIASESVLEKMATADFSYSIVRFGTIYGFSGRSRFDLVINLLTAKALLEGKITIFGGDQWRPFVHVDDAALGVLKVLEAPIELVRNETFNIGSNEQNYTIGQIGEIIRDLIPNSEIVNMGDDTDKRNYRVDFSKLRDVLGYEPQWTVEKGVEQVRKAIEEGKIKDYKDAQYSNAKFLREEGSSRLIRKEDEVDSWIEGRKYDHVPESLKPKGNNTPRILH